MQTVRNKQKTAVFFEKSLQCLLIDHSIFWQGIHRLILRGAFVTKYGMRGSS